MTSRKICIIAMAVVVAGSAFYGMYELAPPSITRVSGGVQYLDLTFEERVEKYEIVVNGEIKDVRIQTLTEELLETDENGNEVIFETRHIPRTKLTIQIQEILKDDYGLNSNTLVVYDRAVSDAIGKINGQKARFISQNAYDYSVGEKGIFFIENDTRVWLHGFTSFYPLEDGKSTITSEFNKKYGKEPIELKDVKDIVNLKTVSKISN